MFPTRISANRLCDAAVVALRAVAAAAEVHDGRWIYPVHLIGTRWGDGHFANFTDEEIVEASEFLVRLGYLEKPATNDRHAA